MTFRDIQTPQRVLIGGCVWLDAWATTFASSDYEGLSDNYKESRQKLYGRSGVRSSLWCLASMSSYPSNTSGRAGSRQAAVGSIWYVRERNLRAIAISQGNDQLTF